jgi:hypothetical protein
MGWVVNATPQPLYPWERDPVSILLEARWASEPVRAGAKNLAPTGIRVPVRPARSESLLKISNIEKENKKDEKLSQCKWERLSGTQIDSSSNAGCSIQSDNTLRSASNNKQPLQSVLF